jgi:hypothetical protein
MEQLRSRKKNLLNSIDGRGYLDGAGGDGSIILK